MNADFVNWIFDRKITETKPTNMKPIKATVLQSRDPDIKPGTEVEIVGYAAIVPEVTRTANISAHSTAPATVCFELHELRLHGDIANAVTSITGREDTARPDVVVRHPSAGPELRTRAEWAFQLGYDLDGNVDTNGEKVTIAEFNRSLSDAAQHKAAEAMLFLGGISKETIKHIAQEIAANNWPTQRNASAAELELFLLHKLRAHVPIKAPETTDVAPVLQKRNKLPDTRHSITHKFDVGGQKGYITVGCYPQDKGDGYGQPGEVFIHIQRQGSTLQGFADAWARSLSMLLQYGVPVSEIARMFAWHKFEPRGHTPNPDIPYANSLVDYVARFLGYQSIPDYNPGGEPVAEVPNES
jgi:hypothetical protein